MAQKIKNFFKSEYLKKLLKFSFESFIMILVFLVVVATLVSSIYIAINLYYEIPLSSEYIDVFSKILFLC